MARNRDWTKRENAAVVRAYLQMLEQELTGQSYKKSVYRAQLMAEIQRSNASIEWKFRNVSAVLADERCLYVRGYKPAPNYQESLAEQVRAQMVRQPRFFELMDAETQRHAADLVDTNWIDTVMPTEVLITGGPHRPRAQGFHTDYVAREASNRSLGENGEKAVLRRECELLRSAGRSDLAAQVRHVSKTEGDGLGYDILSFTPRGQKRLVEVKTTRQTIDWPMIVSSNEVKVSERQCEDYVLARIYNFGNRTGIYELHGAISATCDLDPLDYRALPKQPATT